MKRDTIYAGRIRRRRVHQLRASRQRGAGRRTRRLGDQPAAGARGRVAQLYGAESHIWWDPKLQGNDYFAETLEQRLQRVKALIAVVSPRYVKSEWGRRELAAFCKAAEEQGGVRVQDKARIFKVLKTPVDRELHPPELQSLLGYEFFKEDPATGKMRELDEIFGPDAEKDFWLKLDDLAHDICDLLKLLPPQPDQAPPPRLASTSPSPPRS